MKVESEPVIKTQNGIPKPSDASGQSVTNLVDTVPVQLLLDNVAAAIYTCDAQGRITWYNDAAATLWGRRPEIGKDLWCGSWRIFYLDGRPMPLSECPMAVCLKEGRPVEGAEIIVQRPDGIKRNIAPHPRPLFDPGGALCGAVNLLVDITPNRQATYKAAESEGKFKAVADLAPVAVWVSDENARCLYVNEEWTNITGASPAEALGSGWRNFVGTDDVKSVLPKIEKAITQRKRFDVKINYINTEKRPVLLKAMGTPRYAADGKYTGYIGILQDITHEEMSKISLEVEVKQRTNELLKKNSELRKSEERFHRMVSEVEDYAIIFLDQHGLVQEWNKGAEKIKGYKAEQIIGKSFRQFYAPEDQQRGLPDHLIEKARTEGRATLEGWRVKADGSRFWGHVVLTALHDENHNIIGYSKVTRDLTVKKSKDDALENYAKQLEIKNKELKSVAEDLLLRNEQLRRSEERYFGMIAEVQDYAIILLNKYGIIENWNKGAEKIKGYRPEEVIGKNFKIFYTPEDIKNNLPEHLLETARKEDRAFHEGLRVRADGTTFWGSTVLTALHDKNNQVIGFSKVTRDLSEIKNAEEAMKLTSLQLAEKNKELESMNQELASFAYVSSHDLQEPLRKIQTFASRIVETEHENLSPKGKDYFIRMQNAALRMQALIEDLLTYSRTNTADKNFEHVDLNSLVSEVKADLRESIDEKNALITAAPLPKLTVISFQFRQLLTNLLSNALKFSKPDVAPRIIITADIVPGNKLNNNPATARKTYHHIAVIDNGIGFEPEHSQKIFEVFQRLHGRSEYTGTGIGLAICKKIVENHGGFITAESELGKGATFHVYIPKND